MADEKVSKEKVEMPERCTEPAVRPPARRRAAARMRTHASQTVVNEGGGFMTSI